MPSLLNGVMGITQPNYHSVLLAADGKGAGGRNQAIVVPNGSNIKKLEDLAGKTRDQPDRKQFASDAPGSPSSERTCREGDRC